MTIYLIVARSYRVASEWVRRERLSWKQCRYITEPYQAEGYNPDHTFVMRLDGWWDQPVAESEVLNLYRPVIACLATHAQEKVHGFWPRFLSSAIAKHGDQDED